MAFGLIFTLAFSYLLMASWHKWGDLITDVSREMWVPLQIMQGKVLYRDIYYFYGILPAYLIAFLYEMFGVTIDVLTCFGMAVALLMSYCLYKLSRCFMNDILSFAVVMNFCFVCAFGVDGYENITNYIFPYSFASTFCMLFIAASLYYFIKYIETENIFYLVAWSLLLTVSFLARPETTLPIWFVFLLSGLLVKNSRYIIKYLVLLTPVVLSVLLYWAILYKMDAFDDFVATLSVFLSSALTGHDSFSRFAAGFNDVKENVVLMMKSFLYFMIIAAGVCTSSHLAGTAFYGKSRKNVCLLLSVTIFVLTISFTCIFFGTPDLQYRCIPIILLVSLLSASWSMIQRKDYRGNLKFVTLHLVALALILKILLKTTMFPYGFYLLPIGMISYYLFANYVVKAMNLKIFKADTNSFHSVIIVVTFTCLYLVSWHASNNIYKMKNLAVDTGKGVMYCFNDERSKVYWDAVAYLKEVTNREDQLVVMPAGTSLNFFTERANPMKYHLFFKGDINKLGEEPIIDQLKLNKIKYIAILNLPDIDGFSIGVNYGMKIESYIQANYKQAALFGTNPFDVEKFWIVIYKRNA
jgi:hypothetical protein